MQIYRANSILAFNVRVGGIYRHVVFDSCYGGGSMLTTSDSKLIEAIESHPWYGIKFFRTIEQEESQAQPAQPETEEPKEVAPQVAQEECVDEPTTQEDVTVVEVNSIVEARDYLREHGVSKGLRSKEDILNAASSLGVTFKGI